MLWIIYQILKFIGILVIPFIILIRGSIYIYENHNFGSYPSLIGGASLTIALLFIYFTLFYGKVTGRIGSSGVFQRRLFIVFILVLGYAIHGIFFVSGSNLKSDALRSEVLSLHPILRLGVSTLIHLDKDLIVTDASRTVADYDKLGLKRKKNSLHYKQSSGYSHAVDLRVKGRSELRNRLTQLYFVAMGFNTLRHGGTADHLHVSLISKDKPWAK